MHSYYPDYLWATKNVCHSKRPRAWTRLTQGRHRIAQHDVFKGQDYAPDASTNRRSRSSARTTDRFSLLPNRHSARGIVPDEELSLTSQKWNDPPFTRDQGYGTMRFTPRAAYAAMMHAWTVTSAMFWIS